MTIGTNDWAGAVAVKATQTLTAQASQTLTAGSSTSYGPFYAGGTSYAIQVAPQFAANPTKAWVTIDVTISDPNGILVDETRYDLPSGAALGDNVYVLQGPLANNYMSITVTNRDTVGLTYNLYAYSNNINRLSHTCTTAKFNTVMAGLTIPANCIPLKGILHTSYVVTIGAGTNVAWIYPPSPGPVTITIRQDFVQPSPLTVAPYISENNFIGILQGNIVSIETDANGNGSVTANFPRTSMEVFYHNSGAGNQNISITAVFDCTSG
jgi:hypothetical protein